MSQPTYQTPENVVNQPSKAIEMIPVYDKKVWCDGTLQPEGRELPASLGHPKVYLNMGHNHWVDCPYCGKRFVLSQD